MNDEAAVADRLICAADRLEQAIGGACADEPTSADNRWVPDGYAVYWADPDLNDAVTRGCTPAEAGFIAALDPHAVTALVPVLRVVAAHSRALNKAPGCACYICQTRNGLDEFARRLLRKEDR